MFVGYFSFCVEVSLGLVTGNPSLCVAHMIPTDSLVLYFRSNEHLTQEDTKVKWT